MEYTVTEIGSILMKRKWIIVILVILCTAGSFAVTEYMIQREYTASVSMYVTPDNSVVDVYAKINDLNYAQEIINTYLVILGTQHFLDIVSKESGLDYSANELKSKISFNPVGGTEIFEVHVTTKDPRESLILANTISRFAPKEILELKKADAIKTVDPARLPSGPSAPNVLLNTMIGFAGGLMLGIMVAFLLEITDKRIKDENDFTKHFEVPVLGTVPQMNIK